MKKYILLFLNCLCILSVAKVHKRDIKWAFENPTESKIKITKRCISYTNRDQEKIKVKLDSIKRKMPSFFQSYITPQTIKQPLSIRLKRIHIPTLPPLSFSDQEEDERKLKRDPLVAATWRLSSEMTRIRLQNSADSSSRVNQRNYESNIKNRPSIATKKPASPPPSHGSRHLDTLAFAFNNPEESHLTIQKGIISFTIPGSNQSTTIKVESLKEKAPQFYVNLNQKLSAAIIQLRCTLKKCTLDNEKEEVKKILTYFSRLKTSIGPRRLHAIPEHKSSESPQTQEKHVIRRLNQTQLEKKGASQHSKERYGKKKKDTRPS